MVKEKKITIKHFLNKKVKPKEALGAGYFPIYTHITYDRKTTTVNLFPEINKKGITKADFEYIFESESGEIYSILSKLSNNIKLIINHELSLVGKDFQLKGISKRYGQYFRYISDVFGNIINDKFSKFLEKHLTVFQYKNLYDLDQSETNIYPAGSNFIETYYKVRKNYIRDINEKIKGTEFEHEIACYSHLLLFENVNGNYSEENPYVYVPTKYTFFHWLSNPQFKTKFSTLLRRAMFKEEFIYYLKSEDSEIRDRAIDSYLLVDFKLDEEKGIAYYTSMIDSLILQ